MSWCVSLRGAKYLSAACYTVGNTYGDMVCGALSRDGTMVSKHKAGEARRGEGREAYETCHRCSCCCSNPPFSFRVFPQAAAGFADSTIKVWRIDGRPLGTRYGSAYADKALSQEALYHHRMTSGGQVSEMNPMGGDGDIDMQGVDGGGVGGVGGGGGGGAGVSDGATGVYAPVARRPQAGGDGDDEDEDDTAGRSTGLWGEVEGSEKAKEALASTGACASMVVVACMCRG